MKEITGDIVASFYSANYDAVCCTTNMIVKNNGELVMGAGVAKVFAQHFSDLPKVWGERLQNGKHKEGFMVTNYNPSVPILVAFPTKKNWKDNSSTELILQSLSTLEEVTKIMGWKNILLPRPGCSNGGLNWELDVKPLLELRLDERYTIINKD